MNHDAYWNTQGQLISRKYDDIYFSSDDGMQETEYVFLQQNHLKERFEHLPSNGQFIIGETGFGTGLNFLTTCLLWQQHAPQTASLFFISAEKYPLCIDKIAEALKPWRLIDDWTQALLNHYPARLHGTHRIHFSHNISLTLIIDDAQDGFERLIANPFLVNESSQEARQWCGVDAWFLDGFAPAKNPDMWQQSLFDTVAKLSHSQTTLSTFTAAGAVKRGLTTAGFTVKKIAGYGRKREMIIGNYSPNSANKKTGNDNISRQYGFSPWALRKSYQPLPKTATVAVLGGGLAGCHTAKKLAERGYKVTLYEKESIASGASGNAQGIVYAKLSFSMEPLSAFNLFSLLYAQRYYGDYWQTRPSNQGERCGILQLSWNEKERVIHEKVVHFFKNHPQLVRHISAVEASQLAGTTIHFPALYLPQSGWLAPKQVCYWLLDNGNITIKENTALEALEQHGGGWRLHTSVGQTEQADCVIICNAYDANQLLPESSLPVKKIRGQITHYPQTAMQSPALQTVICGKGYIAPSDSMYCIGASFNQTDHHTTPSIHEHRSNIENAAILAPDVISQQESHRPTLDSLSGRVSFRCTTPDYLPIVGQAPIVSDMQNRFVRLRYDGSQIPNQCGSYYPNLFINIGHGSRGLCYTPLCSEVICSQITGSPPPLAQPLLQRLHPARFLIRDLIRNA